MFFIHRFVINLYDSQSVQFAEQNQQAVENQISRGIEEFLKTAPKNIVKDFGWVSYWQYDPLPSLQFELTKLVLLVNADDAQPGDYFYYPDTPLNYNVFYSNDSVFKRVHLRMHPQITDIWK
ncbi:MAG: hypothetical protein ACREPR_24175 [Brasilonema sp.]